MLDPLSLARSLAGQTDNTSALHTMLALTGTAVAAGGQDAAASVLSLLEGVSWETFEASVACLHLAIESLLEKGTASFTRALMKLLLRSADSTVILCEVVLALAPLHKELVPAVLKEGNSLLDQDEQLMGRAPLVVAIARAALGEGGKDPATVMAAAEACLPAAGAFGHERALVSLLLALLSRGGLTANDQRTFAEGLVGQLERLCGRMVAEQSGTARGGLKMRSQLGRKSARGIGPPSGVQCSLWVRLQMLAPLLPLVRKDTPKSKLRARLAAATLRALSSKAVHASPDVGVATTAAAAAESAAGVHGASDGATDVATRSAYERISALSAFAASSAESLPDRLMSVLHALLDQHWAAWLSAGRVLREVAANADDLKALASLMGDLPLPEAVRRRCSASLPRTASAPSAPGKRPVGSSIGAVDPWLLLEGGPCIADRQRVGAPSLVASRAHAASYILEGAVRVRREPARL